MIRQGLLRLQEDLLVDGERLVEFPRIWVLALSKADLFPKWDVYSFRDTVIAPGKSEDARAGKLWESSWRPASMSARVDLLPRACPLRQIVAARLRPATHAGARPTPC